MIPELHPPGLFEETIQLTATCSDPDAPPVRYTYTPDPRQLPRTYMRKCANTSGGNFICGSSSCAYCVFYHTRWQPSRTRGNVCMLGETTENGPAIHEKFIKLAHVFGMEVPDE